MQIPKIGSLEKDDRFGWYLSQPVPISVFHGRKCKFAIAGYDEDDAKSDYESAIARFLQLTPDTLREARAAIYRYYLDYKSLYGHESDYLQIHSEGDVLSHIQFGNLCFVERRPRKERAVYISVECECAWEAEHGLQIVFKDGQTINKIGPYDGHLTNSDAFGDDDLENIIYQSIFDSA